MDFVLNNIKYQISDMEVFIAYLLVDSYFKDSEYDIHFDFLDDFEGKLTFDDLKKGSEVIKDSNINFINSSFTIEQHINGNFKISVGDISFKNINVGEATPLLIVLDCLLNLKPAISLDEIKHEADNFIATQRQRYINND